MSALWASAGVPGQLLGELLDEAGLPHRAIPLDGRTRMNLIVFSREEHEQYRFGMPGAPFIPADEDRWVREVAALEPHPAYMVLSGSLPPGVDPHVYGRLAACRRGDCRVVVDTSGPALEHALTTSPFLIKPNRREFSELVGGRFSKPREFARAAQALARERDIQVVVVSLGNEGLAFGTSDEAGYVPAPAVRAESKVGAGDSSVAGIVHALARGESVADAIRWGVAAGAAAVMTPGTRLCRREDTERLLAQVAQPA